ncbi:hypothetical protein NDU88_005064 [Pleurodeles waltl]|uniref:Uncharacterized protein n=1 Tax=Pleurodeles waltl TaxID=8319 RepID=A0AAV7UKV1_PLEWA|nr:hypothetical protein NDU88_005064 [Pleurodeles waltl]
MLRLIGECDGSDRADPHTIATSVVSANSVSEATRGASLPIGSPWCPRDGGAVKEEVQKCREEIIRSGTLEEATAERNRNTGEEQGGAEPGDVWSSWEKSSLDLKSSKSRPRTKITGPGEHTPRTRHTSGETWPSQVRS